MIQMLADRQYQIIYSLEKYEVNGVTSKAPGDQITSFEKFISTFVVGKTTEADIKNSMGLLCKKSSKDAPVAVVWHTEPKLTTNFFKIYNRLEAMTIKNAIIIVDENITSNTQSVIRRLKNDSVCIQTYILGDTLYNPSKHVYVPKHRICTETEKKKLFKEYNITHKSKLPHILMTDAQVKYLGAKKSQLIEVERKSVTQPGHKSIFYRLVV